MQWQAGLLAPSTLAALILASSERIACAMSSGAGAEIWLQVELALLLCEQGASVERQLCYPAPRQRWHLDLWAELQGQLLAIELRVENAANSGSMLLNQVHQELAKLVYFTPVPIEGRWVAALAHSSAGRAALKRFSGDPDNHGHYFEQADLGLLLAQP